MDLLPDPEWYLDNVLAFAEPDGRWSTPGPAAQWSAWWARQAAGARSGLVLSPAELTTLGVTRQRARTLTRRGTWAAAGYGFVAPIDIEDDDPYVVARRRHALACVAAVRRRRDHVISARSGATVHGLPTFRLPPRPELTALMDATLGRHGTSHIYGARLLAHDTTSWFGAAVTTVARTLVDLGRHDRRDAIMSADAALREGLTDRTAIDGALAAAAGWPGVRQARLVLVLADPRAESPLESLTRLALHDDGFPAPKLQAVIGGYRVDMLFVEQALILEIDGLGKYSDAEWRREKRREIRLRKLGYRVERVTWDDIVNRWPETSRWLRRILRLPLSGG